MAAGYIVFPLILYVVLMGAFSALVGAKTTRRMGWLMAAGLTLPPAALFVAVVLIAQ